MCGIAGAFSLQHRSIDRLTERLRHMNHLLQHRGPDDEGIWVHPQQHIGFGHRRLSIIDTSSRGHQPMSSERWTLVFNGEIFNFSTLKTDLNPHWSFQTHTDTEVILASHQVHGSQAIHHLNGMFAYALWDEAQQTLLLVRDRLGIKPLYYTVVEGTLYFASEVKALLPFLPHIEIDPDGLTDYLRYQYPIGDHTLIRDIQQLAPGHFLRCHREGLHLERYWDIDPTQRTTETPEAISRHLSQQVEDSVALACISDVPIGSYLSGGLDSSLISLIASQQPHYQAAVHGRFLGYEGFDESRYAMAVAAQNHKPLHVADLSARDFIENADRIVYHLDYPIAGPGSFPQFMVSQRMAEHVKVVLGGQGGDEVFGGYARYLVAYLERALAQGIQSSSDRKVPIALTELAPGLSSLKEYAPLIKKYFSKTDWGNFGNNYVHLIEHASEFSHITISSELHERAQQRFFNAFQKGDGMDSYWEQAMYFELKHLLPALLHVEDRVSMAHGLEARVPFLDHRLVEYVYSIPSKIKFKNGQLKYLLKHTFLNQLPQALQQREDKMGFPIPFSHWRDPSFIEFVKEHTRNIDFGMDGIQCDPKWAWNPDNGKPFSRTLWCMLSLSLWMRTLKKVEQFR